MKARQKLAILSVVVLALSLIAYGTVAYFTAEGTAHNVVTMGSVKIELHDETLTEDGEIRDFNAVYPGGQGGKLGVMPATTHSKIVSVENTGTNPCWVRVQVQKYGTLADGTAYTPYDLAYVQLDLTEDVYLATDEIPQERIEEGVWIYNAEDNWFYYSTPLSAPDPLKPGIEFTPTIFESVTFDKEMGNKYQESSVEISVSAEAVQSANNGTSWNTVASWAE